MTFLLRTHTYSAAALVICAMHMAFARPDSSAVSSDSLALIQDSAVVGHDSVAVIDDSAAFANELPPPDTGAAPVAQRGPMPATADTTPVKISSIVIYGNKITREKTVRLFMSIDTGMIYDSVKVADSKRYLQNCGLFKKVEFVPHRTPDGVRLYIILTERPYWFLSDIGGELKKLIYGYSVQHFWWKARLGAEYRNFRGRKERLGIHVSIWKYRSLRLSWAKPFLKTPYSLKLTASVAYGPDQYANFDRLTVTQSTSAGRRILKRSLLYLTLLPTYEVKYWRYADSTDDSYSELFVRAGWVTDKRNRGFDTRKGFYLHSSLKTNAPYPRYQNYNFAYVQNNNEVRVYHRGIFPSNTMAYRLRTTLRYDSAGPHEGLHAGGETTLRGYPEGALPRGFVGNNSILFTGEYRFPIFQTPKIEYPLLSLIHGGFRKFFYRLDGAAFVDCAYMWHYLPDIRTPRDEHDYGVGPGLGLRVIAPTLQLALCGDAAWGTDKRWLEWLRKNDNKEWIPVFYVYVNMLF